MEIVLGAVVGFLLLIVVLVSTQRSNAAHDERLRELHAKRRSLFVDLRKMQENMQQLKLVEQDLRRRLTAADGNASHVAETRKERVGHQHTGKFQTVIDLLLHERLLTPEQLAKARSYKEQSGSPYPLYEILSMLDYVRADVVQRLRQRHPNLPVE